MRVAPMLTVSTPRSAAGCSTPSASTTARRRSAAASRASSEPHGQDDQELLAAVAIDRVRGTEGGLERLDHLSQDLIAREVTEAVVDGLEVVDVDLDQAVGDARAMDVRPNGPEVLYQAAAVAGPGERIDPGGQLQRVMHPLELEHVGVGATSQRPDGLQLGEVVDLGTAQQDVSGQAGADGDDHDDEEVIALTGRESPDWIEAQVDRHEQDVRQEPAQVGGACSTAGPAR